MTLQISVWEKSYNESLRFNYYLASIPAGSVQVLSIIKANNLAKSRNYQLIFENVSFNLDAGELMWLKGANGSGKTSLLRILAGLSQLNQGDLICNTDDCLYISHQLSLVPELTVMETLKQLYPLYDSKSQGSVISVSIDQLLTLFQLTGTKNKPVKLLSAGQKQRLKLMQLSLYKRNLWLLDEPYSNLDKSGVELLNNLISQHLNNNGSVILTSHFERLEFAKIKELNL